MAKLIVFLYACGMLARVAGLSHGFAWAAADQLDEIRQERTEATQREQFNELRRRAQVESLRRAQRLDEAQRRLDQVKRRQIHPQRPDQFHRMQGQLDQLKNNQQLNRLQNELQLNRIQREQDEFRRQEQIRAFQREQQLQFLRDQLRNHQIHHQLNRLHQ